MTTYVPGDPDDPGPGYRDATYEEEALDIALGEAEHEYDKVIALRDKVGNIPDRVGFDCWRDYFNILDNQATELQRKIEDMQP